MPEEQSTKYVILSFDQYHSVEALGTANGGAFPTYDLACNREAQLSRAKPELQYLVVAIRATNKGGEK